MNNRDKTKSEALGKLDVLVREAIGFYNDTGIPDVLKTITPYDTTYFKPEQFDEIRSNLERINESLQGLVTYCRDRDIDIPKDIIDVNDIC